MVRAGCQEGWLRLTEVKCCRLETRALSWQVDTRHGTVLGFNGSKRISDHKIR